MFDVQFITHFTASISYPDSARIALEGGCRWVQLRMKDVSEERTEKHSHARAGTLPPVRGYLHH